MMMRMRVPMPIYIVPPLQKLEETLVCATGSLAGQVPNAIESVASRAIPGK